MWALGQVWWRAMRWESRNGVISVLMFSDYGLVQVLAALRSSLSVIVSGDSSFLFTFDAQRGKAIPGQASLPSTPTPKI